MPAVSVIIKNVRRTLLKLGKWKRKVFLFTRESKTLCNLEEIHLASWHVFTVAKVDVMEGLFFQQHYRGEREMSTVC